MYALYARAAYDGVRTVYDFRIILPFLAVRKFDTYKKGRQGVIGKRI